MGLGCIFAPVVINLLTVRKTLVLGTIGWSVYSAALYVQTAVSQPFVHVSDLFDVQISYQNNRYGTEWFVLFAAAICGISAGLYWASEGAIVLSYPSHQTRARYLAMWTFCKNT
jgi:MFS family permease